MINVYEQATYRSIVESLIDLGQKQTPKLTLSEVARKTQIQPSYLSNVLKNRNHLNADQLFQLLTLFELSDEQIQFSLDLLEWERSQQPKRRAQLKEKLKKQRDLKLRAENYIQSDGHALASNPSLQFPLPTYYLDPIASIIHMYFGLDKVETNFKVLAEKFRVTEERISAIVKYLQKENLVEFKNGRFKRKPLDLHLPKDSPLTKVHQLALRNLSLEHFARSDIEKHYSMMATFNADAETRMKIQIEFLKFIRKCQQLSKNANSEEVVQLNFELFSWDL